MADQQQPIHHSRPQGRGVRASLALAGLLTLTVPLVLSGVTWLGAVPALAAPYTLTGTAGQAGSAGGTAGTDALNPVPPALPQADLSVDSFILSGGLGGTGQTFSPNAGGRGGAASLTVSNDLTSTANVDDLFTGGNGGSGGAAGPSDAGGAGGAGGGVIINVGNNFTSAQASVFSAGNGGSGGAAGPSDAGGAGGAGGNVTVDVGGNLSSAGTYAFSAGNGGMGGIGGMGGGGGAGGAGGNVIVDVGGNLSSTGASAFNAGNGGAGPIGGGGMSGAGGNVTVHVVNNLSAGTTAFSAGNGGSDGVGGAGGKVTVHVDGDLYSAGTATLNAGNGGRGISSDGNGGAGGNLDLNIGRGLSAQGLLSLNAGLGGSGSNLDNAPGGAGGSASLNASTASLSLPGGFSLLAGTGGNGGAGINSPGGAGGAATLTAKNLTFTGTGSLTSGNNGPDANSPTSPGGAGGAAGLTVIDTLTAYGDAEFSLVKNSGALTFAADTLLLNAESSAGATANARFSLLHPIGGQELGSDAIRINTLILAGEVDGFATVFTTGGNLHWAAEPAGGPNEFYIPRIVVRGAANQLVVEGFTGRSLSGGRGLQDMTFEITGREANKGPMLSVNPVTAAFDLAGLADKISIVPLNALNLNKGTDKITFIRNLFNNNPIVDSSGAFSADKPKRYTSTFGLTEYNFDLLLNGQDLMGTYMGLSPQNYKPYFEGLLGELATLNNSGNAVARTVGQAAALPRGDDWRLLVNAEAQHVRIDTGSHLDNDTLALTLALARQLENRLGALTLGAFFETGWGDHSTYNNLERFGGVDGNGDTNFYGGGLFARQDFNCGFYAEASGRVGIVDYNFDVDDRRVDNASYDDSETYWGAHAGLGYLWRFSERNTLEAYDKLFWTHVDSGETSTDANEKVHYDAMDSLRNRLGARLHHEFTDQVSAYLGAAWEYEFDGAADGSVRVAGESLSLSDSPDMRGSTGVGELGLAAQPAASVPLYIDLSVYGLVGTQEGVGGAVQFKYTF